MDEMVHWPAGARPLRKSVFAQPYSGAEQNRLADSLSGGIFHRNGERQEGVLNLRPGFVLTSSRIDFEHGEFYYGWEKRSHPAGAGEVRLFPPWPGFRKEVLPEGAFDDRWARLLEEQALLIWQGMVLDLESRFQRGEVMYFGRIRSPFAPIAPIAYDIWRHLEVEHWELGTALSAKTQERVFSVHVLDNQGTGISAARRSPREDDFADYLLEAISRASQGLPMTISDSEAWAKEKGLSREFARAARQRLTADAKLKPGEKKADRNQRGIA